LVVLQQVKIVSYILAFYLILLSAVPCCAFDSCPDDKMDLSAGAEQHENGDDDYGSCSPFFSCEGCATATVSFEPVQLEIVLTPLISVYTGYIQTSLPQIDYDFWQPPKIG
jgi:hypothetical protein